MIEVDLLDNRDEALAPRGIDTLAGRVIVHIIRVTNTRDAGYHPTAIDIENVKLCWLSRHHEEAVVSFVQRHGIIGPPGLQRPIRDFMSIPIDNHHFRYGSNIRVKYGLRSGNLNRFWVGNGLGDVIQAFATRGIDDCNTTLLISTVSDIYSLFCRIVAHIIGILSNVNRVQQLESVSVVDPELSIGAVGDEEAVKLAYINHTLRRCSPGDAVYVPTGECIDDLDRVVAQSSTNDALAFWVEGEMIDPSSNIRYWNFLDQK